MSEAALRKKMKKSPCVCQRVTPAHKVRIVKGFQDNGQIVAMTGDGVNDAPSLQKADIGIAMGQNGTDAAKNAADMVLSDDNFSTIEKAMEEGRGIYVNIKKSILFLLSSNFGEIITMFAAVLFQLPTPLKASHILWVNLITDSLPALALGIDKNDAKALMRKKPRNPHEGLFAHGGWGFTVFYGVLIAAITLYAFYLGGQTYAFTVLGVSQLFHAIGMRDKDKSVFRMKHLENSVYAGSIFSGLGTSGNGNQKSHILWQLSEHPVFPYRNGVCFWEFQQFLLLPMSFCLSPESFWEWEKNSKMQEKTKKLHIKTKNTCKNT